MADVAAGRFKLCVADADRFRVHRHGAGLPGFFVCGSQENDWAAAGTTFGHAISSLKSKSDNWGRFRQWGENQMRSFFRFTFPLLLPRLE